MIAAAVLAGGSLAHATPSDDLFNSLQPTADVNDFADILTPQERAALEQRCRQLRANTGSQLAVVILRSLQGGQIDDFTVKLFERWKVGQADKDNGVMLLVAIDDRKVRIEVGYGLEPVLPDVLAGRIIQQQIVPAFRQKQYAAGLSAAVNRIAEIVERGEPAPQAAARDDMPATALACFLPFLIVWTGFPSLFFGICARQRQIGPLVFLPLFLAFGYWFAYFAGMPWWGFIVIALCDVAIGAVGYNAQSLGESTRRRSTTTSGGFFDGWTWGDSSWSGGSSSWSGGGFSGGGGGSWGGFGGGSSGGGGASGGW